jgi:hypothetical protein
VADFDGMRGGFAQGRVVRRESTHRKVPKVDAWQLTLGVPLSACAVRGLQAGIRR